MRRFVLFGLLLGAHAALAGEVKNPHGAFSGACAMCHSADSWKPAVIGPKFDHGKYGFRLEGAHTRVACLSCHATLEFAKAPSRCVDCHADVHRGEFGTDCARCHSTRNFIDRADAIRTHRTTRFPLTGAHAAVSCQQCHPMQTGHETYVNTPAECESCHMDDYNAVQNPDHKALGFSTDCSQCHSTLSWSGTQFNHSATAFPLSGAHRSVACADCHVNNQFGGLPADCNSCHAAQYASTTSPPHGASGFSTDCRQCHSTSAWQPSTFDHGNTGFALTGTHKTIPCASCHPNNQYAGAPSDCYSCHSADYTGTTNPPHQASGFSTDCQQCHNATGWQGASFNHDASFFPIYSGRHRGIWSSCATCHINASNYTQFTCFNCHPHDDRAKTDGDHRGRSGYSYDSAACYRCHPRGNS
jgi:hypothetical protein